MGLAYKKIREIIKSKGGSMTFHRKGRPQGGSWRIKFPKKPEKWFDSDGGLYIPLDNCYKLKPGVKKAKSWSDYTSEIDHKGLKKLLSEFK